MAETAYMKKQILTSDKQLHGVAFIGPQTCSPLSLHDPSIGMDRSQRTLLHAQKERLDLEARTKSRAISDAITRDLVH